MPYEKYVVTAVDVPNIPTGCHQAPSPEPPLGHVPQTLAACILVHVASLHAPLEALHQYLLSLPVSTIIGRKCGRALIMPPVSA
jgi:hypothetical protein